MNDWLPTEKTDQKKLDYITITSSKAFGFPAYFMVKNSLHEFNFISLYFSPSNNAVAIKFTKEEEEKRSFKIIGGKNDKTGGYVIASQFFSAHNIELKNYIGKYKYKPQDIENIGHVYIIELDKKQETNKIHDQPNLEVNLHPSTTNQG